MGLIVVLLISYGALANDQDPVTESGERISSACEIQEQDTVSPEGKFHRYAQSWLEKNGGGGSGSIYADYMEKRYGITSGLQKNSLQEQAFAAAVEDLPPQIRQTFKGVELFEAQNNVENCQRPSVGAETSPTAAPAVGVCTGNLQKSRHWKFADLKLFFSHELGHVYAAKHDAADYKQDWMGKSKWFVDDRRNTDCRDVKMGVNQCHDYSFIGPNNTAVAGSRPINKEGGPQPGFVSSYAGTSPAEDFAETFQKFRYSKSFAENAQKDPVLAEKYKDMEKIFGKTYGSSCKEEIGDSGTATVRQ